jgi:hypothetical protein
MNQSCTLLRSGHSPRFFDQLFVEIDGRPHGSPSLDASMVHHMMTRPVRRSMTGGERSPIVMRSSLPKYAASRVTLVR